MKHILIIAIMGIVVSSATHAATLTRLVCDREVQRYTQNGNHCYNDYYYDSKEGDCESFLLPWQKNDTVGVNCKHSLWGRK